MITIKQTAIKAEDGKVFSLPAPKRYSAIVKTMIDAGQPTPIKGERGFLDSEGNFVSSATAFLIAQSADQIISGAVAAPLYPEDIFPT